MRRRELACLDVFRYLLIVISLKFRMQVDKILQCEAMTRCLIVQILESRDKYDKASLLHQELIFEP
jgi:hypothetical protein